MMEDHGISNSFWDVSTGYLVGLVMQINGYSDWDFLGCLVVVKSDREIP